MTDRTTRNFVVTVKIGSRKVPDKETSPNPHPTLSKGSRFFGLTKKTESKRGLRGKTLSANHQF